MNRRQQVLLVDDSEAIQKLTGVVLRDLEAEILPALTGTYAAQVARHRKPDLILLDVDLPDMDGFLLCQTIKGDPATRDIPIIFLTGSEDTASKLKAFSLGAADYVVKPFNHAELRARVSTALRNRALSEMLSIQAHTDQLTGLANRARLYERIEEAIRQFRADPTCRFAVLFLDLDRFKIINDSLGHQVGDMLLVAIARRLSQAIPAMLQAQRSEALLARLGGDEFVVLLENTSDAAHAARLAEAIHDVLGEPYLIGGQAIYVTASIGIASIDTGPTRADEVIRNADTAMYHAKSAGRGCYASFDQQMHEQIKNRLQLENDLRQALSRRELILYYQPVMCLENGHLVGFEALVRWQHPTRGMVSPVEFIPVAEETGLILPLGEWVLNEACQQLSAWQRRFSTPNWPAVSINLSRRQLMQPNLVDLVQQTIRTAGVCPSSIHIEITESTIMHDMEAATTLLEKLKNLGAHLDMDDFGTGYSSLSCLHRFPLQGLKIDKSFIANMASRREYAAVVHAILTLAYNLGIRVTAEGVETFDQVVQLQAMGCENAQGYYFGKPAPPSVAETIIASQHKMAQSA